MMALSAVTITGRCRSFGWQQDLDDLVGVADVVVLDEFELFELGVLADQVLDRVLELGDQVTKGRFVRRVLRVADLFEFDAHLRGDRHGVLGRLSIGVVVDRSHGGDSASLR